MDVKQETESFPGARSQESARSAIHKNPQQKLSRSDAAATITSYTFPGVGLWNLQVPSCDLTPPILAMIKKMFFVQ